MSITIDPTTLSSHFEPKEAEERWERLWREWEVHRFDEEDRGPAYVDRHAAADRVGLAARGARLQLHADGRAGAPPPDARQERLLPDGLGRQRPPDRAARPELLPRALRGPRALRARASTSRWPTTRRRKQPPRRISRANFIELCLALTAEDEKAFKALWQRLGLSVDWRARVLDDQRAQPARRAVELPRPPPQGAGVPGRGADPVGRGLPDRGGAGRGRGPAAEGRLPPRALRGRGRRELRRRHDAPRAAAGLRGGGRAPRRRALPLALREAGGDARSSACRCPSSRASSWTARRAPAS